MGEYDKYKIKNYTHWSVFIHHNQGYLGRCIIWCNRDSALDLADATAEEQQELFVIINDLGNAIKKCFGPHWLNYAFLGNETRHLHGHLIPRYAAPKEFEGITFKDERWGHNYKTDHSFVIPDAVLEKIKNLLTKTLH